MVMPMPMIAIISVLPTFQPVNFQWPATDTAAIFFLFSMLIQKTMKKRLFVFLMLLCSYCIGHAQSNGVSKDKGDEAMIRQLLAKQTEAWNRGDIESFMQTYWKSDSLMFIGKNGVTYGWSNTLNNYKKNYPDTISMGRLSFDILWVERLSPDYFQVIGKWRLQRSIGDLAGHYSLLIKKINGNWVIVSDHSS